MRYPLAGEGVFRTLQGEGALLGLPMVFIRLAGCSVGCPGCDTDYGVRERATADEIADRVGRLTYRCREWVWITGGEPTDHDLAPLLSALRRHAFPRIAVATAGIRPLRAGWVHGGVDFLSVSPHREQGWVQRSGDQINLVPGLNGLTWEEAGRIAEQADWFAHRWITPCEGDPEAMSRCVQWVHTHPGWRLGIQAHKQWRLP